MKKFAGKLAVVFLVMLIAAGLAASVKAQDPETLEVLSVFPSGQTPRVKQFTVAFNQPMVSLGDMNQAPDPGLIRITPDLKGQYRWLNVYTLAFEPNVPLEGSLEGEIVIPAGLKSLSGAQLLKEYRTGFALPKIKLLRTDPAENTHGLSLGATFQLVFNQPLALSSLKTARFEAAGQRIGVSVEADEEANQDRQVGGPWFAIVRPQSDLPRNQKVQLVLPAGLVSTVGPLKSDKEFRVSYQTYGPLKVTKFKGYSPKSNLPFDPESGLSLVFSNPVAFKDIAKYLRVTPEYDLSSVMEDEYQDDEATHFWLPGPFAAEARYNFEFQPGLKDKYGQLLEGNQKFEIAFGPARPILELPGRQGVLESSSPPLYPLQARNIKRVDLRGFLLEPDQVIPFVINHKLYQYLSESKDDALEKVDPGRIRRQSRDMKAPANTAVFHPVDLAALFGPDSPPGLMYFDVSAAETNDGKTGRPIYRRALVQISDFGLSVKFGRRNTLIWATDLTGGRPLEGVRLEIRNSANKVLWRGLSGQDGLVMAPGARELEIVPREDWGRPDLFVLGWHGDRFSLVSSEWNDGISPWNFGLAARELTSGDQTRTWVLNALPLYKPGDEVKFKVIQRVSGPLGDRPPGRTKLLVRVEDSRGQKLEDFNLQLNRFGSVSASMTLASDAPLGEYIVRVGPNENELYYVGYFRVDAYRKPDFGLDVETSAAEALAGDRVTASLAATYHFGAPVPNRPGTYSVTSDAAGFSPANYEDYSFVDYLPLDEEPEGLVGTVADGRLTLDDKGRAQVAFQAAPPKHPAPQRLQVEATVTGVDQRTVSSRASVLVHPAAVYVGLKTDDYLVETGRKIGIDLVAMSPAEEILPGVDVELVLARRTWQTVRRKGVGGYYHYISKAVDTEIGREVKQSGDGPKKLRVAVPDPGYYVVTAQVKDSAGRVNRSSTGFYAYGQGSAGWERYDHDRIDLIPDKKEYRPGDTAVLMVKSPFTSGSGLLTVERDGVRRSEVFNLNGPAPVLKVPLNETDGPNVFVSVVLVQGRISEQLDQQGRDPGKPAFKVGYAELIVHEDRRKLVVEVTPDRPEAGPGDEVELDVKVTDASGKPQVAEVAVIAADKALLQLADENTYYPEKLFFALQYLGVWTADQRLNLIGRRHYGLKGASAGGGGLGAGGERFRQKFVSLALFEPHLVTGADGRAKVKFKLPDNLTTFKIFAVAADDTEKFGTGDAAVLVTKPLLIKPALPGFIGIGDRLRASVVLHNISGQSGEATVTMTAQNVKVENGGSQTAGRTVKLSAGESREVGFEVTALAGLQAVFRFDVAMSGRRDAAEYRVPLRYPNELVTAADSGRFEETMSRSVTLPAGSDPDRGRLSITVSPTLAGALGAAFEYLREYPHHCLEQKTSRAMGDLLSLAKPYAVGADQAARQKAAAAYNEYLQSLSAFQGYDGGLSFWPQSRESDPYLTAYVMHLLALGGQRGLEVPDRVYRRGVDYLLQVLNHNRWPRYYSKAARRTTGAYAVFALTLAGQDTAALLENLYADRQNLSPFELSQLLAALNLRPNSQQKSQQIKETVQRLFTRAVATSQEIHFEEPSGLQGLMASRVRTNAFVLMGLLGSDPHSPHVVQLARWLLQERVGGHWGSTQNNALALLALTNYQEVLEAEPPDFRLAASLDGAELGRVQFTGFDQPPFEAAVPAGQLKAKEKSKLLLERSGPGAGYYVMRLDWAPLEPDLEATRAGFILDRSYSAVGPDQTAGPPSERFRRGDLVRVETTILVPNQRHWVVVEDLVPAGLEPINFNLAAAPAHLQQMLNQDQRPGEYFSRYWYEHLEIRHDRVVVYARMLREGVYTLTYLARAVTPGRFIAPGPRAEEMYTPEVWGRGRGAWLEVAED